MKNFFKSFTIYQICYLLSVLALTIIFVVLFPDMILEDTSNKLVVACSIIAVLANPICELLISKQSKWNFIVSIVFIEITETILYFSLGYYACALISTLFWIPIDILSFVNWNKNEDEDKKDLTVVKRLTFKQDILAIVLIAAFGGIVGFLLTLIPGAEDTYLDAFCSAVGMANGILLYFRYNEQWYAWCLCLILEIVLYVISGSYIMLITVFAMLVNTCYGFVKWLSYTQNKKTIVDIFKKFSKKKEK